MKCFQNSIIITMTDYNEESKWSSPRIKHTLKRKTKNNISKKVFI